MDAFYEQDERILGLAADPYHRIDIRPGSRHLDVRYDDQVVADTHDPRFCTSPASRRAGTSLAPASSPRSAAGRRASAGFVRAQQSDMTIAGEKLEAVPGLTVRPHGSDWNPSVDEIGGARPVRRATPAEEYA
jgi:hypothetical protein